MSKKGRRTQLTIEIANAVRDKILESQMAMTEVQIQKALEGSTSAFNALQKQGELVGVFPKGDDSSSLFLQFWRESIKGALEFYAARNPIPIATPTIDGDFRVLQVQEMLEPDAESASHEESLDSQE